MASLFWIAVLFFSATDLAEGYTDNIEICTVEEDGLLRVPYLFYIIYFVFCSFAKKKSQ